MFPFEITSNFLNSVANSSHSLDISSRFSVFADIVICVASCRLRWCLVVVAVTEFVCCVYDSFLSSFNGIEFCSGFSAPRHSQRWAHINVDNRDPIRCTKYTVATRYLFFSFEIPSILALSSFQYQISLVWVATETNSSCDSNTDRIQYRHRTTVSLKTSLICAKIQQFEHEWDVVKWRTVYNFRSECNSEGKLSIFYLRGCRCLTRSK